MVRGQMLSQKTHEMRLHLAIWRLSLSPTQLKMTRIYTQPEGKAELGCTIPP